MRKARRVEGAPAGEASGEVDALRGRLMAELRRRPGDMRSLTRSAEAVSRMTAAQNRLSPKRGRVLAGNVEAVLSRFQAQLDGVE